MYLARCRTEGQGPKRLAQEAGKGSQLAARTIPDNVPGFFTEFDVTKQWMREPGSELPIPLLYLQDCVVRTTVSERDRSENPIELW